MNQLAMSLAGHDKGKVYVIVGEEDGMVHLANGLTKTLQHPKKKKEKHIRRIRHLPGEVERRLETCAADSDLVHVLRVYQKTLSNE